MTLITTIFSITEYLLKYCKYKLSKKNLMIILKIIISLFVSLIIGLVIIIYPYIQITLNYTNEEYKYNYYDNFEENIKIKYEDVGGYEIRKRDVNYLQQKLDNGYIEYNNKKTRFIPIDDRSGCKYIESGGIIHYASADDKVLYKHKNCIPKNQHIIYIKE